ncbi:MAG: penicillin-binding protein 2 [Nitrospiraceae bacterium]|nr:penicillin-binding protein 2 [Nitrospiraceae bacterium]
MAQTGQKKRPDGVTARVRFVMIGLVLAMSVLVVRLWDLQVVHWFDYAQMAEYNRLRPERLKAPRGTIYGPDESIVLADNRSACDLVIVPAECRPMEIDAVIEKLDELVGIDEAALRRKIEESKSRPYRQVVAKQDVSRNDLMRVEEFAYALPGVFPVARPQRRYVYGDTAGQILGYLGEVGEDELGKYKLGDLIGRSGLEQVYESAMRGTDGQLVVSVYRTDRRPQLRTDALGRAYVGVDSYGRQLEQEFRVDPEAGGSIFTTLDIGLQARCEEILEDARAIGAIAVLNADTGAVLTLASTPGYDPSVFVTHGRARDREEALVGKLKPMRSRAYQEAYPPASVFKVMLAVAALEEGVIDENTTHYCPGRFRLDGVNQVWRCWKSSGHGNISVVDALAFSCDVFFYNVGLALGVDRINEWAAKFGLGRPTGIDLPHEVSGLIPSRDWWDQVRRPQYPDEPWEWRWYPGKTVNLAIGQGEATTTPLQNAMMMAAVINGGRRPRPFVNMSLGPELSEDFIGDRTIDLVHRGMRKCVDKDRSPPTGTGKAAKIPGMIILGKTGTAQIVSRKQLIKYGKDENNIPYFLRDHAWFVAGVLDREPRIAVSVLVEHGLHGSSAAAPLAKLVIEYFYASRQPPAALQVAQEGGAR